MVSHRTGWTGSSGRLTTLQASSDDGDGMSCLAWSSPVMHQESSHHVRSLLTAARSPRSLSIGSMPSVVMEAIPSWTITFEWPSVLPVESASDAGVVQWQNGSFPTSACGPTIRLVITCSARELVSSSRPHHIDRFGVQHHAPTMKVIEIEHPFRNSRSEHRCHRRGRACKGLQDTDALPYLGRCRCPRCRFGWSCEPWQSVHACEPRSITSDRLPSRSMASVLVVCFRRWSSWLASSTRPPWFDRQPSPRVGPVRCRAVIHRRFRRLSRPDRELWEKRICGGWSVPLPTESDCERNDHGLLCSGPCQSPYQEPCNTRCDAENQGRCAESFHDGCRGPSRILCLRGREDEDAALTGSMLAHSKWHRQLTWMWHRSWLR